MQFLLQWTKDGPPTQLAPMKDPMRTGLPLQFTSKACFSWYCSRAKQWVHGAESSAVGPLTEAVPGQAPPCLEQNVPSIAHLLMSIHKQPPHLLFFPCHHPQFLLMWGMETFQLMRKPPCLRRTWCWLTWVSWGSPSILAPVAHTFAAELEWVLGKLVWPWLKAKQETVSTFCCGWHLAIGQEPAT